MKRNLLLRRPWLTAGIAAASVVLVSALTFAALNLRPVHASGPGGSCESTSTVPTCTFSGHNGVARFERDSDCAFTNMWVYVSDNFTRSGASTRQGSYLWLVTDTYSNCTGSYTSWGWGADDAATVQFSATANSLTVHGTIDVQMYNSDGTSTTTTYPVDLTWRYFGTPGRSVNSFHHQSPGVITDGHYNGTSGNAIVSGTLSDGTTNFAATPSTDAEELNADSGTFVTIQK